MCSLSASPLPTPRLKRPSSSTALVAAAWAMIAGWMRTVGQVTPVVTGRSVACASAPITDHTNGAVALLVVPRVVVVGDPQRVEAGLPRRGLACSTSSRGRELLAREEVADLHGRRRYPGSAGWHAADASEAGQRAERVRHADHHPTKAVSVLTLLLIIIVLLLLFGGGWGYSRRGRRI